MSILHDILSRIRRRRAAQDAPAGPIISTPHGPVTEWARKQAAENMQNDPDLRRRVFEVILKERRGDVDRAKAEARRRFPEVEWDD